MRSQLNRADPYDRPACLDAPSVLVVVEELRLSHFLIIHRRWCPCPWERPNVSSRTRRPMQARDLRHLLELVWPHSVLAGYTTRDLARRCAVATCAPPLPIHPWHRTLMKEHHTMSTMPVLACPNAQGKFIVHEPTCGHVTRIRATKNGSGVSQNVASLEELVRLLYVGRRELENQADMAMLMEQDFEIAQCLPLPPFADTVASTLQEKVDAATLRAYSALTALVEASDRHDTLCATELGERLERRRTAPDRTKRTLHDLTATDVREHLVASAELLAWCAVRDAVMEGLAADVSDMDKAKRWVATARAMVRRLEQQWRLATEQGGTTMGRAFVEAEQEGHRRFANHAMDALHEVAHLMEQRGSW